MVICLERRADLLMPLPLTLSCFSKIQIGFTFLVRLTWVIPEKGPLNGCVCNCVHLLITVVVSFTVCLSEKLGKIHALLSDST